MSILCSKDPLNADPTKPNSFVDGDKKLKRTIMKNVILIAIAFMVLFTSFQSMASLQSSINQAIYLGRGSTLSKASRSKLGVQKCQIHWLSTNLIKIFLLL